MMFQKDLPCIDLFFNLGDLPLQGGFCRFLVDKVGKVDQTDSTSSVADPVSSKNQYTYYDQILHIFSEKQ